MQRRLALILVLLLAAIVLPAGSKTDDKELARQLDLHLQASTARGFSGSVLVARGRRILLNRGYGWADSKHTRRATPDTRYWVASISKQFTAAAILKLEEDGRLSTSDPIAKFLPGVPPDKQAITLHQLLTHTSGLAQNYAGDGVTDLEGALKALCAAPLAGPPGEEFRYANDNYNLLAIIVQLVSGQSFEGYLRQRLFQPTGLKQSGFWGMVSVRDAKKFASVRREPSGPIAQPNWGFRGAVGAYSTAEDLFRWQQALFAGRILSAASRDKLLRSYLQRGETEIAYGWYRSRTARGRLALWTRGTEDFGHNAVIKVYPELDLVVVIASNAGDLGDKTRAASRVLSDELEAIIENEW